MKTINHTQLVKTYKGKWVILDESATKVLASDTLLKKAILKFHTKYGQSKIPSTFKVPTEILPYVGMEK